MAKALPGVQRQAAEEELDEEEIPIQAKCTAGDAGGFAAPPEVQDALRSPGRPLDGGTRDFMEARFGRDFGDVRVHTDAQAAESAQAIGARAYTSGREVVFGAGEYAPGTHAGRKLIAHELTHTLQQGGSLRMVQRDCAYENCGDRHRSILDDIYRAFQYVDEAQTALRGEMSENTRTLLQWFFSDNSRATADTVLERLRCIEECLIDTHLEHRYGCDMEDDANAYVEGVDTAICVHQRVPICLTSHFFGRTPRLRAATIIHECAHRVGMSLGSRDLRDVYDHTMAFLYMDTEEALRNCDSYALFAASVATDVSTTTLISLGLGTGVALGEANPLWLVSLYFTVEMQNPDFQVPVLGFVCPTFGLGVSVVGSPESEETEGTESATAMISALAGVRFTNPRAGGEGSGYAWFYAGPALAVQTGAGTTGGAPVGLGAEAGMMLGYRWHYLDISAGAGYQYNPTAAPGVQHVVTPRFTITVPLELHNE